MGQIGKQSGEDRPMGGGAVGARRRGAELDQAWRAGQRDHLDKAGESTGDCPKGVEDEEWLGQKELYALGGTEDPWRTCVFFRMAEMQDSAEDGEARDEGEGIGRARAGCIWYTKELGMF